MFRFVETIYVHTQKSDGKSSSERFCARAATKRRKEAEQKKKKKKKKRGAKEKRKRKMGMQENDKTLVRVMAKKGKLRRERALECQVVFQAENGQPK